MATFKKAYSCLDCIHIKPNHTECTLECTLHMFNLSHTLGNLICDDFANNYPNSDASVDGVVAELNKRFGNE